MSSRSRRNPDRVRRYQIPIEQLPSHQILERLDQEYLFKGIEHYREGIKTLSERIDGLEALLIRQVDMVAYLNGRAQMLEHNALELVTLLQELLKTFPYEDLPPIARYLVDKSQARLNDLLSRAHESKRQIDTTYPTNPMDVNNQILTEQMACELWRVTAEKLGDVFDDLIEAVQYSDNAALIADYILRENETGKASTDRLRTPMLIHKLLETNLGREKLATYEAKTIIEALRMTKSYRASGLTQEYYAPQNGLSIATLKRYIKIRRLIEDIARGVPK